MGGNLESLLLGDEVSSVIWYFEFTALISKVRGEHKLFVDVSLDQIVPSGEISKTQTVWILKNTSF
jgi:hypothetical protein